MSVNYYNKETGELELLAGGSTTLYADAPIGSYLAMKDNSVKPQGYLLSDGRDTTGTDDELSTKYPLLYAYLGNTNILPTELDHSVLGVPEDISTNLNHTTNSSYYTAPYDGVIIINWTPSDRYKSVYWSDDGTNWTEFVYNLDISTYQTTTVPVKKGDRLYLRDSIANSVIYARFYKQYKYIKATQVAVPADIAAGVEDMLSDVTAVIPSEASTNNKLVVESEISKTERTLAIGGSAAAIVKIDVSLPFLETDYGKFTEIDFQVRSDNIRFFISANDGVYLVTAQYNYRSAGWLTGLNYLVNGSKSISLYVSILNYPATVGAKLVFNGLDGTEITEISTVSALPSGSAVMKQSPIIYAADLTSTVTLGSSAPITSGGVYSALNNKTSVTATSANSVYIDNAIIYYYPQTKRMLFNRCAFVYTQGATMPAGRTLCTITIPDGITIPEKGIMIPAMLSVAATDEKLPSAVILNTNGTIVTTNSETNYNYVKIYGVNVFFE